MLGEQFEGANDTLVQADEARALPVPADEWHRALVEIDDRHGALVVTPLVRHLDAENAPALRQVLAHVVAGRRVVVVCLSHVTSIDCSGLAALVSGMKRLGPGGELRLASVCDAARALLAATHLEELLPAYADADSAACV